MAMASCVVTCQACKAWAFMHAFLSWAPLVLQRCSPALLPTHPCFRKSQECRGALGAIHVTRDRLANPADAIDNDVSALARDEQRRHVMLAGGGVLGFIVNQERLSKLTPGQRDIDSWAPNGLHPGGTGITRMHKASS